MGSRSSRAVSIRPVCAADERAFVSAARRSRSLHHPWTTAPCDRAAFRRYLARFDGKQHCGFVVLHARTGELIGAINLTNIVYGAFRSGYLGYLAFAGHQRQGLMKQGLELVVRHAFRDLGLHRVEANVQPGRPASIALVRSCGFSREGFSPAYLKIGGRWRDHERWALVRGKANAAGRIVHEAGLVNFWVKGEFTVTCDPARMDRAVIAEFLASSYWARGIAPDTVGKSMANSLCFALLQGERLAGFARVITDRATIAYLADVFVLPEYRGRGLSKWLMECVVSHPELQGLRRWMLATLDAHGLYEKSGFTPLKKPGLFMERHDPDVHGGRR